MSALRIPGLLLVAASGVWIASACSSFGDAATPEADAAPDVAPPDARLGAPDAGDGGGDGGPMCTLATTPSVVATVKSAPSKLQSNGEHVFWIEGGASVQRASLLDCSVSQVAVGNINALAVDLQWIAWGKPTYEIVGRNDVGTAPKSHPAALSPSFLLAGGTAFWIDVGHIEACDTPCTATTNAMPRPGTTLLAANALRFFFFGPDPDSGSTGDLWWQALTLSANDKIEGPLATGEDPILLAPNDTSVFWVNADGQLKGLPSGGGTPIPLPKVAGARALAVDKSFVYVATKTSIGRVPVGGGALVPVVDGEDDIRTLTLTSDAVLWGTSSAIRRVRK